MTSLSPPLQDREDDPLRTSTETDTRTSSTPYSRHFPQYPTLTRRRGRHRSDQHRHPSLLLTPQEIEQEEDMDDSSSRWSDIHPSDDTTPDDTAATHSSSSSSNSNSNSLLARWRRRQPRTTTRGGSSSNTIKLHLPCLLCDCVRFVWDWTFAAVELWVDVLTAPPFPLATLQKVSIVLLGVEKIRDNIDHAALLALATNSNSNNHHPSATNIISGANYHPNHHPNGGGPLTLASIPHYLIWGIPAAIALLSISFVLTLQLTWGHQEEAVIATALVLLIFLEALLPLFILGCTSMFLFQQVSWETGMTLLIIVWLGSTFAAHCIRRMLYQSLGHG